MEPLKSFKSMWVAGEFDSRDYFALTAPLKEWSVEYPTYCISEFAGGLADQDWGVVHHKLTVYIYSSESEAQCRAKSLGTNVKPLKLKCLACFIHALSTHKTFADIILDEAWHIETMVCRENELAPWNTLGFGVLHVRLHDGRNLFELSGCAGNGNLQWRHLTSYGDRRNSHEWCRPIPHPYGMLTIDHTPQGGPVDIEMVLPADTLEYFSMHGRDIARSANHSRQEILYARPVGTLAYASLMGEKIQAVESEGVWIPIGLRSGGAWRPYPWAGEFARMLADLGSDPTKLVPRTPRRIRTPCATWRWRFWSQAAFRKRKRNVGKVMMLPTSCLNAQQH